MMEKITDKDLKNFDDQIDELRHGKKLEIRWEGVYDKYGYVGGWNFFVIYKLDGNTSARLNTWLPGKIESLYQESIHSAKQKADEILAEWLEGLYA